MILFYVLGFVVCIAIAVVAFLFYFLRKESAHPSDVSVIPIINPQEIFKPTLQSDIQDKYSKRAQEELEEGKYRKRVEELEEELRVISEKGVSQAQEAMAMIDALTKENQALKDGHAQRGQEQDEQLVSAQSMVEKLHSENDSLQEKLGNTEAKFIQLQEELVLVRKQTSEELVQSKTVVEQFKNTQTSTANLNQDLSDAKLEIERLKREVEIMREEDQKLKELNAQFAEKSQSMQYELTKNRAQVSGLERICENYKSQLGRLYETQNK